MPLAANENARDRGPWRFITMRLQLERVSSPPAVLRVLASDLRRLLLSFGGASGSVSALVFHQSFGGTVGQPSDLHRLLCPSAVPAIHFRLTARHPLK